MRLLFVRRGRLVETLKWALPLADDSDAILRERIVEHFVAEAASEEEQPEPTRYFKAEIEEIRLLAHWLYVNREASQKIDWQQEQDEAQMVSEVMAFLQGVPVD